ncbi:MAG TPA: hypothetical protein EYG95_03965 [Campylobacterales bacterium]|nr:hypothetical protein [Campylobacterales bacterium]
MKTLLLSLLMLLNLTAAPVADDKKLIVVYIEMEYCGWCKKMDRETMDEPHSKATIEKRYHIAKIKKESGNVPLFLHPKFFPTTYILSSDGANVIDELPGYMQNRRFLEYLKELYEVENQIGA